MREGICTATVGMSMQCGDRQQPLTMVIASNANAAITCEAAMWHTAGSSGSMTVVDVYSLVCAGILVVKQAALLCGSCWCSAQTPEVGHGDSRARCCCCQYGSKPTRSSPVGIIAIYQQQGSSIILLQQVPAAAAAAMYEHSVSHFPWMCSL